MAVKTRQTYTVKGFTGNYSEIARHFGLKVATLKSRLNRGWDLEKAVSMDVNLVNQGRFPNVYSVGKFRGSLLEIESRFGVSAAHHDSDELIKLLAKRIVPKFYKVGNYRGTLKAIAQHYSVSFQDLRYFTTRGGDPAAFIEKLGKADW